MLVKFDTKSVRVKGLAFHSKRPWVLASLHNGVVQLWDYQMGVKVDSFAEHEGPVRGVDFNASQPLFVSGGDDARIKVWNHKQRRCLFTLLGHLDYIRTVKFHSEYPWIVSASDDQTIRIWNWQARSCVSVMTGHNHYVMSAAFHPKDDLLVSASLDQTVRVWDTTGLRKKTVRSGPPASLRGRGGEGEYFGAMDAVVKYVLEGHDRGVNWAAFHPTQPLIVSGADDRCIKLWRMSDTRAWEVDSMRGHQSNVSCVLFHPRHDLIVSNSEDRSIRVWDANKRVLLHTYRRESDRFWILAAHPTRNLLAAGHDGGLSVFKLDRERPAFGVTAGGNVLFVRDRYLRRAPLGEGGDGGPVVATRRFGGQFNFSARIRTLTTNPFAPPGAEHAVVYSRVESGSWDLYDLPTGGAGAGPDPVRGSGLSVAFLGRNKLGVLDRASRDIQVRNMSGELLKSTPFPGARPDKIFQASTSGRVLVKSGDSLTLFELASRRKLGVVSGSVIKYVTWSADGEWVALQGKNALILADRSLNKVCSVTEASRIKGGAWDASGVFVYATPTHLKYLVAGPRGDSGIIRSLGAPLYPVSIADGVLLCFNRSRALVRVKVDTTEFRFKIALARAAYGEVVSIIQSGKLAGAAVISYLRSAGFPEVALHFAVDPATRFDLAVQCGNLGAAESAATELDDPARWAALGRAALDQGDVTLATSILRRTGDVAQASFLALITGQLDTVAALAARAAAAPGDRDAVMAAFSASLATGDVAGRVGVLEGAGQIALAYTVAATHGLGEVAERLGGYLTEAGLPLPDVTALGHTPALLTPPPVVAAGGSWPKLAVSAGLFDGALGAEEAGAGGGPTAAATALAAAAAEAVDPDAWDDDLDLDLGLDLGGGGGEGGGHTATGGAAGAGGEWGDDLDLDLSGFDALEGGPGGAGAAEGGQDALAGVFIAPTPGRPPAAVWGGNASLAGEFAAAGQFSAAADLLNRQIGIVNFAPLLPHFRAAAQATRAAVPGLPGLPGIVIPLHAASPDAPPPGAGATPRMPPGLPRAMARLSAVYRAFQGGKFAEVSRLCDLLFATLPLVTVSTRKEEGEARTVLATAREYKTAVTLELARKTTPGDTPAGLGRQVELAAYMTHCDLRPPHALLALNLAMSVAFKAKNFIHSASFARRLLEVPDASAPANAKLAAKAKKVLALSEQQARNALTVEYDPRNPFDVCCGSLKPIYRGSPLVRSPFAGAAYTPAFNGTVCVIDGMSAVGTETLGLVLKNTP